MLISHIKEEPGKVFSPWLGHTSTLHHSQGGGHTYPAEKVILHTLHALLQNWGSNLGLDLKTRICLCCWST